MAKQVPDLPRAPKPVAPYSVATEAAGLLFVSGQVPIDSGGGPTPTEVADQARLVMDNLVLIVEDLGLSLDHIVKTTIFLADIADFARVNEVYGSYFEGVAPPARTTVQAAALPRPEFKLEIEAVVAR